MTANGSPSIAAGCGDNSLLFGDVEIATLEFSYVLIYEEESCYNKQTTRSACTHACNAYISAILRY